VLNTGVASPGLAIGPQQESSMSGDAPQVHVSDPAANLFPCLWKPPHDFGRLVSSLRAVRALGRPSDNEADPARSGSERAGSAESFGISCPYSPYVKFDLPRGCFLGLPPAARRS